MLATVPVVIHAIVAVVEVVEVGGAPVSVTVGAGVAAGGCGAGGAGPGDGAGCSGVSTEEPTGEACGGAEAWRNTVQR